MLTEPNLSANIYKSQIHLTMMKTKTNDMN